MVPALEWSRGDSIEVQIPEPGFEDSFFPATFLARFLPDTYLVQYKTLLTEDKRALLLERVPITSVRPVPLSIPVNTFCVGDVVDAWARDGWWKGTVVRLVGQLIEVRFPRPHDADFFTYDRVRLHQRYRKRTDDWVLKKRRRSD